MNLEQTLSVPRLLWLSCALAASTATAAPRLTLEDAVHQALSTHPRIRAAVEQWQAAESRAAARNPPSDPEVELEVEGMGSAFDLGSRDERSIGVTQRLALPMSWRHGLSAARSQAAAVRLEAVGVARLDVALETARAYLDAQLAERLVDLEARDLELARDLARIARRRHEVGDAPHLATFRAEVEAARTEVSFASMSDAAAAAQARLCALLDHPLDADLLLADSLAAREIGLDEVALQAQGVAQRPEFVAAAYRLEAAQHEARAARTAMVPAIDVGLFRHDFQAPGAPATWRLGLTVEVPLWAAHRQRADVAAAEAEARRLGHLVEETRRRVALEIHTALLDLESARRTVRYYESGLLREAEEAYTIARRSWEQGEAPQVDVLDARRTLTQVRVDHARAVHTHEVARHSLARAVGAPLDPEGGEDR